MTDRPYDRWTPFSLEELERLLDAICIGTPGAAAKHQSALHDLQAELEVEIDRRGSEAST